MIRDDKKSAVICVHEDRAHCLTGAKLCILSLRECCPKFSIVMSSPAAPPAFVEWLNKVPGVTLVSFSETKDGAWNVKPTVLLRLLNEGYSQVIWVDSDIVVHRDVLTPLAESCEECFGGTEETYWGQNQGGTARTSAWGLKPGREMPCTVNSGVLRVTQHHLRLLQDWRHMLRHPIYLRAQALPWYQRPLHMITDQEVLTGLLGSEEYAHIPLALLRRGIDIAQCMGPGGFTPWERFSSLWSGLPGMIHSMGIKPWVRSPHAPPLGLNTKQLREYYEYLHVELTPYVSVARRYGADLNEDLEWMNVSSVPARLLSAITLRNSLLQEFPLALIDATARSFRRWMNIGRYSLNEEFCMKESPLLQDAKSSP